MISLVPLRTTQGQQVGAFWGSSTEVDLNRWKNFECSHNNRLVYQICLNLS